MGRWKQQKTEKVKAKMGRRVKVVVNTEERKEKGKEGNALHDDDEPLLAVRAVVAPVAVRGHARLVLLDLVRQPVQPLPRALLLALPGQDRDDDFEGHVFFRFAVGAFWGDGVLSGGMFGCCGAENKTGRGER